MFPFIGKAQTVVIYIEKAVLRIFHFKICKAANYEYTEDLYGDNPGHFIIL